jgi:hypothetical protein
MATDEDLDQQSVVFSAALKLYSERDAVHQGLWKNDDAAELAEQALHKAKRVKHHAADNPAQAIEDATDMINYAAFTIRKLINAAAYQKGIDMNGAVSNGE